MLDTALAQSDQHSFSSFLSCVKAEYMCQSAFNEDFTAVPLHNTFCRHIDTFIKKLISYESTKVVGLINAAGILMRLYEFYTVWSAGTD